MIQHISIVLMERGISGKVGAGLNEKEATQLNSLIVATPFGLITTSHDQTSIQTAFCALPKKWAQFELKKDVGFNKSGPRKWPKREREREREIYHNGKQTGVPERRCGACWPST